MGSKFKLGLSRETVSKQIDSETPPPRPLLDLCALVGTPSLTSEGLHASERERGLCAELILCQADGPCVSSVWCGG